MTQTEAIKPRPETLHANIQERYGLHPEHSSEHIDTIINNENTQERLTQLLSDIISYRTIADGEHQGEMYGLISYVNLYLERLTVSTGQQFNQEIFLGPDNKTLSLMVGINDDPEHKIPDQLHDELFHPRATMLVHGDIVDGPENVFTAKISEDDPDMIEGRGSRDMKNALALFLDLLRDKEIPHGITLTLTTDEEIGGKNGTGYLKRLGFDPESLVIFDGQNLNTLSFGGKAKGDLEVAINTKYFPALKAVSNVLLPLHDLIEGNYKIPSEIEEQVQATTITHTKIETEHQTLTHLPTEAQVINAFFDIRSGEDNAIVPAVRKLTFLLRDYIRDHMQLHKGNIQVVTNGNQRSIKIRHKRSEAAGYQWITVCTFDLRRVTPVYKIPHDSPHIALFRRVYSNMFGMHPKEVIRDTGLNDGLYFEDTDGNAIPTILFLIDGSDEPGHGAHQDKERARLSYLPKIRRVLRDYFQGILDFPKRRDVA